MSEGVRIDFITRRQTGDIALVLVEEGPWAPYDLTAQLRALQDRLNHCVEAVLGGHLTDRFPDANGHRVVLQIDAYDLPEEETGAFLSRYQGYLRSDPQIQELVRKSKSIEGLSLEFQFYSLAALAAAKAARAVERDEGKTVLARVRAWLGRA